MNKLDIITLPVYEFFSDNSLADRVVNEVKVLDFGENIQNSLVPYTNETLFAWFNECIDKIHAIYYSDNLKLNIVSCWVNKTNRNEKHHFHTHPNSIVSGIYYLTDHSDSETLFYTDDPWMKLENENILRIGKNTGKFIQKSFITNKVCPQVGKLILFPSHIAHETKLHRHNSPRYTISFNTFFSGKFYQTDNQPINSITRYLELDVKNI